ncbi:MAG TPA: VWA domain-containing protein [Gemmataceae bacterium]
MPVAGGKVKMDLANLGAAQVLDMLGPMDEFACLAVDTLAHGVVDLGPATDKAKMRDRILRIRSEGGGIYVYQALAAAADAIQHAKAGTKHIILFADAADAEEPGLYKELLEKTRKAGITVSVIGLGTAKDKDAAFLEDVARRSGGRLFITDKPDELPRLFAQDTFVVARNAFVDEPVRVQGTPGLAALTGRPFALDRSLGGYNLCYLRPEASLGAFTRDEYAAPAAASWQAGAGRILCFTGEADGKYAGDFARSPETGDFYTSLARWTAGQTGGLTHGMAVTQEVRNGINRLHLDPDRGSEPFAGTPAVRSLRARPGQSPGVEDLRMTWAGPDTLVAEIPLFGEETALSTVLVAGQKPQSLAPVCLPYSPEFAPPRAGESDSGRISLEKLARGTGGMERLDLSGLWKDLPRRSCCFWKCWNGERPLSLSSRFGCVPRLAARPPAPVKRCLSPRRQRQLRRERQRLHQHRQRRSKRPSAKACSMPCARPANGAAIARRSNSLKTKHFRSFWSSSATCTASSNGNPVSKRRRA